MRRSIPTTARNLLAGCGALLLALAGCADSTGEPDAPAPETASTQEPDTTLNAPLDDLEDDESDESTPEEEAGEEGADSSDADGDDAEAGAEGPAALPTKIVEAGKVATGTTRSASGKKDALVTFTQAAPFAVVAEFDCPECKGDIEIQQLGSHEVLDTGSKSLSGAYLLDIIGSVEEEQTLIVRASGEWDVKLRSWDDLPISSGTQEGKGSDVIYIGDEASGIEVAYKPPKGGGKLSVTATSAVEKEGDAPKLASVSGGKKFTKKTDIKLPGVLTISGKGSWTIKLIP